MGNLCSSAFESVGRSKTLTTTVIFLLFASSVVLLVLSCIQLSAVGGYNWPDLICDNILFQYLTPFRIRFAGDVYSCPWRERNTIFRILLVCALLILCASSLVVLFKFENQQTWNILYWIQWFLFIMMFVVFVLDCDGMNTGYQNCLTGFEVDDEPLIPGIEQCYLNPFIWVTVCDFIVCLCGWIVYRVSQEYSFPPIDKRGSDDNESKKEKKKSAETEQTTGYDDDVTTAYDE